MKFLLYVFVGGVAAVLNLSILYVFSKKLGFHYQLVSSIGFILATLLNYVLSVRLVFQSGVRYTRRNEVLMVFAVSFVGLLVNQFVMYELHGVMDVELMISQIIATGIVFVWNFLARNYFVFRSPKT